MARLQVHTYAYLSKDRSVRRGWQKRVKALQEVGIVAEELKLPREVVAEWPHRLYYEAVRWINGENQRKKVKQDQERAKNRAAGRGR